MGMEQPPEPTNENDTPDDGLAIAAVVVLVVICLILGGLVVFSRVVVFGNVTV